MSNYFKAIDRFAARLTERIISRRWTVILLAVVLAVAAGSGASRLEFSSNYRVFFSDANPELMAFENLQNTYTKNDNFLFVIDPQDGNAFSNETTAALTSSLCGANSTMELITRQPLHSSAPSHTLCSTARRFCNGEFELFTTVMVSRNSLSE